MGTVEVLKYREAFGDTHTTQCYESGGVAPEDLTSVLNSVAVGSSRGYGFVVLAR